ncbi:MAG: ABC transporter ATP-binding protein [Methanomicrobiales archaeon]|nr:ABC transporter ATP-binding protein [Methanomicrobiales archaeon]
MTGNTVVEAKNLVKRFGNLQAVNGISFQVQEGEAFGFLGPNGAGKTSTMRMIQCVSPKTSGELRVFGMDTEEHPREIKLRMGVVPQESNLDPDFTVREGLIQFARYFDIPRHEAAPRADELLAFMALEEKKNSTVEKLSGGMRRRLILARALINHPTLLILDEPTTGLDPQARHLIWEKMRGLVDEGNTILLTTHYMEEAARLCDRIVIMDTGKILVEGRPDELVKAHASEYMVEADTSPDVMQCLKRHQIAFDTYGDKVQIFTRDPKEVTRLLLDECSMDGEVTARPTTLEDVFLKLTGRTLRE